MKIITFLPAITFPGCIGGRITGSKAIEISSLIRVCQGLCARIVGL